MNVARNQLIRWAMTLTLAMGALPATGEAPKWSEVMSESYKMGGDVTLDEAVEQIRARLKERGVRKAGEYIAGRQTMSDGAVEHAVDRVQGGTVTVEVQDKEVVMREGEPVARVTANVTVDERDVTRFLDRVQKARHAGTDTSFDMVDRTQIPPVLEAYERELGRVYGQIDEAVRQLRENFISEVHVEPRVSADADSPRFEVRVLWQTASPSLFELPRFERGMPPQKGSGAWSYSRHMDSVEGAMLWGWSESHRLRFYRSSTTGEMVHDTRLMHFGEKDSVDIPFWEWVNINIEPMEQQNKDTLLDQAAFIHLARQRIDVVIQLGEREFRHEVIRPYCAEKRGNPDIALDELKLRNKDAFNAWVRECEPRVRVQFVPDVAYGQWYKPERHDFGEMESYTPESGLKLDTARWDEQLHSPYGRDFPGLGWETSVELERSEDPSTATVSLQRR